MINEVRNEIPFLAILIEFLVAISISVIAVLLFQKYKQRGDKPILYLFYGVLFLSLAVHVSWIAKLINFYLPFDLENKNYSGFGIVTAYCCTIVANTFIIMFYNAIFGEENSTYPHIMLFLNGITFGFIFPNIGFNDNVYNAILYFLIYHIFISFTIFGNLFRKSWKEMKDAEDPVVKTGFRFIGLFGLSVIFLYLSFVLDLIVGIVRGSGYTPFYYIGWISGGFASLFGYLGYIMPGWLRNRVIDDS